MSDRISCGIARDLMPLVIDDACGEESRQAVEAHIAGCAECAKVYEAMKVEIPKPAADEQENAHFTQSMKKTRRKTRWIKILCAVLAMILLVTIGYYAANPGSLFSEYTTVPVSWIHNAHLVRTTDGHALLQFTPDQRYKRYKGNQWSRVDMSDARQLADMTLRFRYPKLAKLLKKEGHHPLLAACDIYRPAAIDQLQVVGERAGVKVFEMGQTDPVEIAAKAVRFAKDNNHDVVILDTAGRLHIDEKLMDELKNIKAETNPDEIMLVVDAMTGQDAVNVAKAFDEALGITGVLMSKLDSDTRGGAALSVLSVTGKPIKYVGMGEKLDDFEQFHPDRMASRILGMGDVLSLIEKAEDVYSKQEAERLAQKLQQSKFDMNDLLAQMRQIQKMGDLKKIVSMLPGVSGKLDELDIDEKAFGRVEAMITSMTPAERAKPSIINPSRKKRIAKGSGTQVQDVNRLRKQFEQMQQMMKKIGKGGKGLFGRRKMPKLDPSMLEGIGGFPGGGFPKR